MRLHTSIFKSNKKRKKHTLYFLTQINQKSSKKKKNKTRITMNKRKEKGKNTFFINFVNPFTNDQNTILPIISLLPPISPKPLPRPILSMMPTTTPLSHKRRIKMSLHPTAAATATATPPHLRPTYNSSRKKTNHQNTKKTQKTNNLSPISNHRMLFKDIFIFPSSTFFNEKDVCANDFVRHTRSMNNAQVFFLFW
jgi:hypothetical protein